MATGTVIGSLRVILGADTAAFESGLKDAQKSLGSFGSSFSSIAGKLGITAAATKFALDVKGMIDKADELGKASQKFGVPVEALSALQYAAKLTDVSFEGLEKGLGKLSKAMFAAVADPAGEAAKNFKALGVSATDTGGNLKSTEAIFTDIAEKFSTMEDGAGKTALAIKLFGKAGADLIPLLNQGKTGIQSMMDEAKKLGIVIDTETAAKAEKFNDTLKRIGASHDALVLRFTAELLPSLQKIADGFTAAAQNGSQTESMFKQVAATIETDLRDYQALVIVLGFAGEAFKQLWVIISSGLDLSKKFEAAKALTEIPERMANAIRGLNAAFADMGKAGSFESLDNLPAIMERVGKGINTVNTAALASKNAIDSFIASQQKSQAAAQADIQTANAWIGTREAMRITMEAEAIAQANNITLTNQQREALKLLADQAAANAVQLAGVQMTAANLTPWQAYQEEMKKINQLYDAQAISAQTAERAGVQAAIKVGEAYATAAGTALGGFAAMFMAFGEHSKKMFEVGKAFAIAEAVVNTYKAANLALAQPPGPPFSYVYVAGAIAAGIANVMKITSQKPPAFATGGMMQIPGSGGIDSRMLSFMGSPGETVRVDQNKYGEGGAARTITLAGVSAKDYYRGDVLRDFVANLNEAIGDGLKIKLA